MNERHLIINSLIFWIATTVLTAVTVPVLAQEAIDPRRDYHSFANVDDVVMTHVYLHLNVNFDEALVDGYTDLTIKHLNAGVEKLVLDTKALKIKKCSCLPRVILPIRPSV
jgi:hypothetical protein